MINIVSGYIMLWVAWQAHEDAAVTRYWVAISLSIINFTVATAMEIVTL